MKFFKLTDKQFFLGFAVAAVVIFTLAANPIKNLVLQGNMDAAGYAITNLGSSTNSTSAATRGFVETNITAASTNYAPKTRTITVGPGLSGGGDLSADRTISIFTGSTAGTVAAGDDPRFGAGGSDPRLQGTGTLTVRTNGSIAPLGASAGALTPIYIASAFRSDAEALFFLISSNGKRFLNLFDGATVYTPEAGVVRDPSVIYDDGRFLVAHTIGWSGNSFAVIQSDNLRDWSIVATVDCSALVGCDSVWAPEWFRDADGSLHIIVALTAGGDHQQYELHPTNADLTTWSDPVLFAPVRANMIDAVVVLSEGVYHCFFKNEDTKYIERATASTFLGPYTLVSTGDWTGWGNNLEGISIVPKLGGGWRTYIDPYDFGSQLYYSDAATLGGSWSAISSIVAPFELRHGTVVSAPEAIAALLAVATSPESGGGPATPASLIARWTLNETSGTREDSEAGGYDLTDNDSVGFAAGVDGNAASFDGVSEFLNNTTVSVTPGESWSVTFWFFTSDIDQGGSPGTPNVGIPLALWGDPGRTFVFAINNPWDVTDGEYRMSLVAREGEAFGMKNTHTTLESNTWYFVVGVYDATNHHLKLKINDGPWEILDVSGRVLETGGMLTVGAGEEGTAWYFQGLVDDIRLFNGALTTDEANALYEDFAP